MHLKNIQEELKLQIAQKALKAFSAFLLIFNVISCSGVKTPEQTEKKVVAQAQAIAVDTNPFQFPEPQDKGHPVRYRVKDGRITYQYKGIQTGVEEVYFTDYGMTEIKYTHTERDNPFKDGTEKINMITLMRDTFIYVVDITTMNARRIDNHVLFEIAERSPTLDLDEAARITYEMNMGEMLGIDTINGLPCEKWNMPHQKQQEWRWNGMMIKTLVDLNRNYLSLVATEVDTISPLPEGIFELPKNVNVMEGASLKEWIEDLSKPIAKRQYFNKPSDKK